MKKSGILLHISSLPSPYGIGALGKEAFDFVDFLKQSGQRLWQVLPIGPTTYENDNSPYSSQSAFAFNPYFVDLDLLKKNGLINVDLKECCQDREDTVNYLAVAEKINHILYSAFQNFIPDEQYFQFCLDNNFWLEDYALFAALKKKFNNLSWQKWEKPYKFRDTERLSQFSIENIDYINYIKFTQYEFYKQWKALKHYANKSGIEIVGDMPIYVAYDSSDVWSNPKMFQLDENLLPKDVAGVPPDNFTPDGQLWGNPLYDWTYQKENDYHWWTTRIQKALELYDIVRIDHFRGFESYFAVPFGDLTAKNGSWRKGPELDLFQAIEKKLGKLKIIAEDLGYLDNGVREMVKKSGYPGMKVLQFGFDKDENNEYLPHNYPKECVVYTGTHDNNTTLGWYKSLQKSEKELFVKYFEFKADQNPVAVMIEAAFSSPADTVIIPLQDYLMLDENARMNRPSVYSVNWKWRVKKKQLSRKLSKEIKSFNK